jgi:uncharacterized protein YcsI (UPF0317 family)
MLTSTSSALETRLACRSGAFDGTTAGLAAGFVQTNLVILPKADAADFLLFCQRNPKPCPLVEVLDAGQFEPKSAPGADLRTDLPAYRIYRDGELHGQLTELSAVWREDLVSFLIGCSFTFESALQEAGIALRHIDLGLNVAMYKTRLLCVPAGRFHGNLVVSMRPIKSRDIPRAIEISGRFPQSHGAPVHVGSAEELGVADLMRPDYGDAVRIDDDEEPVFWACGVTPQAVLEASRVPFCITHAPGKMFVTDRPSKRSEQTR